MTPKPIRTPASTAWHPIEDPAVQARVKRVTALMLEAAGGSGKIGVWYHFNNGKFTGESVEVGAELPKTRA